MRKIKIFLTVGTHPQQFDRLIKAVDELVAAKQINGEIASQIGNSNYKPKNFSFKTMMGKEEYEKNFKNADIVICHAGEGAIIDGLNYKKKLIVVPRLKKFDEHTDDHQMDLVKKLASENKIIGVYDVKDLELAIKKTTRFFPKIASNKKGLIKALNDYLGSVERWNF